MEGGGGTNGECDQGHQESEEGDEGADESRDKVRSNSKDEGDNRDGCRYGVEDESVCGGEDEGGSGRRAKVSTHRLGRSRRWKLLWQIHSCFR